MIRTTIKLKIFNRNSPRVRRLVVMAVSTVSALQGIVYGQRTPSGYDSPEIRPDRSVVFRILAPEAEQVQVWGSWDITKRIFMDKKDSIFEATVGPLEPNAYEYEFVVDGVSALDPNSKLVTRDGAWIMNMMIIPGEGSEVYQANDVPHGNVHAIWYESPTLGDTRRMQVYTPPGYDNSGMAYPVLYLLHGGGGDEECWLSRGRANFILDNLIAAGEAEPMIVVMTNGNPNTPAAPLSRDMNMPDPTGISAMASGRFEKSLVNDIIPYIESNYRVIGDADHRAITGFSMGGYQTQNLTNAHPEKFKYIGVMSMGLFSAFNADNARGYDKEQHLRQLREVIAAQPEVYWIGMGTQDFLYETGVAMRALYDEVGLKYTYLENEGTHDWNSWRMYLKEFAPLLFR